MKRANNGVISQDEISFIKRKHSKLCQACRTMLPTAIEIGEWFVQKHEKIDRGQWETWLTENFPEIPLRTIRRYCELALNRQFLEAKFQIGRATDLEQDLYDQAFPTIREALEAIQQKNKAPRKRRRGSARTNNQAIEIESSTTRNNPEQDSKDDSPSIRPIRIAPPPNLTLEDSAEISSVQDPIDVIQTKIADFVSYQELALKRLFEIMEYAELARINIKELRHLISVATLNEPETAELFWSLVERLKLLK
jgi:hypothetical protein